MYPPLAIFILVVITSICKSLHNDSCDVFPRDLYIEVGSSVEIGCRTSCVRGKIFWTLDNRRIDESLSKTINSSHAVLTLRNLTNPIATLQCHCADTQQAVGGTTIRTYEKPSKLSCNLQYKNQATGSSQMLFECNWQHQIYRSLTINYTVLCNPPSCPLQKELCTSHKEACTSNYSDIQGEIPIGGHYNLTVRAKSVAWETSSNLYEFIPLKTLKILQPKLSITAMSDHLLVAWSIPLHIPQYQYQCQVKYSKTASEGRPEWVLNKTLHTSQDKGEMTIGKVESCSNYTFAVGCALDEAPLSTWTQEHVVLTKLNKSDFKPNLWRKVAEADKNGVRNVRAMWTEIPPTCQDTFTYRISQTPYKKQGTYIDTLCENAICDMNQDAHRIKMTVFHNETMFVEDSVYVPAIGESLPQVTNIQTSTLEGVILVSWMAPVQLVSSYMIDYTHNGDQYYWKETKHTNVTLFDLLDKKPYDITVTPLFDDKTGHGSQVLQICSSVGDPGAVAIASVQAEDRQAHVSWTVRSQQACSGVVVNFTVFYSSENQPQLSVTVDGMQREILLKDLKPETTYRVYVQVTALTGTTKSSERFFKTIRFDPELSLALSVGSGILIVLVLSFGVYCIIQWKKFRENPVPNPGHSSLAMWPSSSHEKGTCPFLPIHDLFEDIYDSVYTEEAQGTYTFPLNTSYNDYSSSDEKEESAPAPNEQNGFPFEALETECPSSSGETIGLLFSPEKCLPSPYKSQHPVKTPAKRVSKQCKRVSVKQQEKTAPPTIYVTLDMCLTKAAQVE